MASSPRCEAWRVLFSLPRISRINTDFSPFLLHIQNYSLTLQSEKMRKYAKKAKNEQD
jgi:hypothetical protein